MIDRLEPPPTDVEALGEEIATLSAQIQAATYKLLVLIYDFDAAGGWNTGFRSCAHWLCWRTGLDLGAAREKVRVARAVQELPEISAAMSRGEISYSKVRALTRVATAETEDELLAYAKCGTASHVEGLVRAWRRVDRNADIEEANLRHAARSLSLYFDEDGMLVLRARLEPEAGALLEKALEAAAERLYPRGQAQPEGDVVPVGQRRADALGLVASSALQGELDPGAGSDRYQVVVHTSEEDLRHVDEDGREGRPAGPTPGEESGFDLAAAEDRAHVSAETSRRIACDASKVVMQHASDGTTLDVGRKTRTIPPAVRRALRHRDRGCRFPGCHARFCDAHHVRHWADGGETKLANLVLLCRRHHRAVHEGGFRVELRADGEAVFRRPDGHLLEPAPSLPRLSQRPVDDLVERLRQCTLTPNGAMPTWDGRPVDLAYALDALWRPRSTSSPPTDRR